MIFYRITHKSDKVQVTEDVYELVYKYLKKPCNYF